MKKIKKTTEQFREELALVNPNIEFLGEYLGCHTKALCKCKICGHEWEVRPGNLLSGKGCPKCKITKSAESKKLKAAQEFEQKARKIHGSKYDYSKVIYTKATEKIEIVCPIHGSFYQTPHTHLSGCGCPKCYNSNIVKNTEEFINKAKQIHGNKYDYSKVDYINTKTRICIICPEHGEFWQTPNDHLQKKGCPKCAIKTRNDSIRLSQEQFVKRANNLHMNKYDYSEVTYLNDKTKVCIICHNKNSDGIEHGKFWMTPGNHIYGHQGCPICGRIKANQNESLTTEEFIKRAKEIHGDRYDYSKVKYINSKTKVEIICPKHGSFWQLPFSHLQQIGCPKCSKSKGEQLIEILLKRNNILYLDQYRFEDLPKIIVDFYIPSKNCIIEYNGQQHYTPIEHFGGQLKFEQQQKRDNTLREYCKINNIKLIEIPYTYNTLEKIKQFLNNYNKNYGQKV